MITCEINVGKCLIKGKPGRTIITVQFTLKYKSEFRKKNGVLGKDSTKSNEPIQRTYSPSERCASYKTK